MYFKRPYSSKPRTFKKFTKKTMRKRKSYSKSKVFSYPARLRASKSTYTLNKMIARQINRFSETKLVQCAAQTETPPVAIQAGAQAYFIAYNIGLNATTAGGIPVNGIEIVKGTNSFNRVGEYIFLKKTHWSLKLEMTNANTATPTQFRIMLVKLRRYNNPAGTSPALQDTLFIDSEGAKFGHATSGKTGIDLMLQPTNKRDWVVYRDFKCTLQNYNDITSGNSTIYNHYPCFKDFQLDLPYFKKTKYGFNNNLPIDMDYRYTLIVYSHNINRSNLANDFEMSLRGTTSYTDN